MLSIEDCQKLIECDEEYSDEQIEEIRKTLYALGELALESYFEKKKSEKLG